MANFVPVPSVTQVREHRVIRKEVALGGTPPVTTYHYQNNDNSRGETTSLPLPMGSVFLFATTT